MTQATVRMRTDIDLDALAAFEIRVTVDTEVNFSRLLVDPNGPLPVGPVHVRVEVKPDTPEALATVRAVSEVAKARAPGVYMISHAIPVTLEVTGAS